MKCFRLRCRSICDDVNAYGTSPVEYRRFGSGIWMKTNWEESEHEKGTFREWRMT